MSSDRARFAIPFAGENSNGEREEKAQASLCLGERLKQQRPALLSFGVQQKPYKKVGGRGTEASRGVRRGAGAERSGM